MAFASSASILSKTGSPRPGFIPVTRHSTIPPALSPSSASVSIIFSIFSAALLSHALNLLFSIIFRSLWVHSIPAALIV